MRERSIFLSLCVSPLVGGRSLDGRRYSGDWEIKIEPAERKLRDKEKDKESLLAVAWVLRILLCRGRENRRR